MCTDLPKMGTSEPRRHAVGEQETLRTRYIMETEGPGASQSESQGSPLSDPVLEPWTLETLEADD